LFFGYAKTDDFSFKGFRWRKTLVPRPNALPAAPLVY
jgi:hypothetical protein